MRKQNQLILFVKAPRPGYVKTRLAADLGSEVAAAAYREMVEHLNAEIQPFAPVLVCHSPDEARRELSAWLGTRHHYQPQGRGNLGQRMRRAFDAAFAAGHRRVVLIGSDCPTITAGELQSAFSKLKQCSVVLGPAVDGGYWLIGLNHPQPALFSGIRWSSKSVLHQTTSQIRRLNLSVNFLALKNDIDTASDWTTYKSRPIS